MADASTVDMCEKMRGISPLASLVLTGNFPIIVKNVLSYLPSKGLNTAARVCKQWQKLATELKKERSSSLSWFLATPVDEDVENGRFASEVRLYFESLWSEPAAMLLFVTTNLFDEQLVIPNKNSPRAEFSRAAKCGRAKIQDFVYGKIPKACKLVGVAADGAVGTSWTSSKTVESEGKKALTVLSLPKLEGIDVHTFTIDLHGSDTDWHTSLDDVQTPEVDLQAVSGIPEDKHVKAVLFFCDEPFCPPEVGYSIMRQYEDAVVAGGYVDSLVLPTEEIPTDSDPTVLCIAFCGENLKVASVLMKEYVRKPKDAEKQIMKLKDLGFPEEKSFAFMFACVGRGRGFYGKQNVESEAFRKIFPNTPLFGFFGNGEIGYNCLPSESEETTSSVSDFFPKLYHAYTTVLCLFSVTQ